MFWRCSGFAQFQGTFRQFEALPGQPVCAVQLEAEFFLHFVHFTRELKPKWFFHAVIVTFLLNRAHVRGCRFICAEIIEGLVSTRSLFTNPPAWETRLHLLFAVDNMRMFALDHCRINQNVLTPQHKGLF